MADSKISWDGKINVPTVIMALGLLVGGVTFTNTMASKADQSLAELTEFRADLKEVKASMRALEISAVRSDGLVNTVNDHESRIRALESR